MSENYVLQNFSRISFTRKIRTCSSFSKGNVPGAIETKCFTRKKDFPFRPVLEKAHKRSRNIKNGEGIQNFSVKDTIPGKNSPEYNPIRKSEISSGKRDQRNVGEGSNRKRLTTQRSACSKSISELCFPFKKKRWGLLSGYQSENSE